MTRRFRSCLVSFACVLSLVFGAWVVSSASDPSLAGAISKQTSAETPRSFLAALAGALRKGDTRFLFDRLNPAVLYIDGSASCHRYLSTLKDSTAHIEVLGIGSTGPYLYKSRGRSATVAGTTTVSVLETLHGVTGVTAVHVSKHDGHYTWFTWCVAGKASAPSSASASGVVSLEEAALAPYLGTYSGTWADTRFNVGGSITVVVAIDKPNQTLDISLTFTGPLFGAPAPGTESLPPISLANMTFGSPITGTSAIFGPYTVTYNASGTIKVTMPSCPPGSCTLTGTLQPGKFTGTVAVVLHDGSTSQGTVNLTRE